MSLVGVEGTGSYGVGLDRFLHDQQIAVVEVDRPNRQTRRKVGKSDPTDAVAAARAALSGAAGGGDCPMFGVVTGESSNGTPVHPKRHPNPYRFRHWEGALIEPRRLLFRVTPLSIVSGLLERLF